MIHEKSNGNSIFFKKIKDFMKPIKNKKKNIIKSLACLALFFTFSCFAQSASSQSQSEMQMTNSAHDSESDGVFSKFFYVFLPIGSGLLLLVLIAQNFFSNSETNAQRPLSNLWLKLSVKLTSGKEVNAFIKSLGEKTFSLISSEAFNRGENLEMHLSLPKSHGKEALVLSGKVGNCKKSRDCAKSYVVELTLNSSEEIQQLHDIQNNISRSAPSRMLPSQLN
ncbi:MAG: hypothetical protein KBD78_02170 [Oligoflexales bacterium]|nr:hypothetical protein [Oligoflexales bacterium]